MEELDINSILNRNELSTNYDKIFMTMGDKEKKLYYTCICTCTCMYMYMYMYVYTCMCMYVCVHVCV